MARYLQTFPYVAGARLGKQNLLTARMNDAVFNFEVGRDWMPLGISANQSLEQVPVVFVKYGITASELNYNDYSDPKVAGRIGGMDVYDVPAVDVRRRVGMVFQKPNPFPTMSIYDNVAAGLKLNGTRSRKTLDDCVER